MELKVQIKNIYGNESIYPACDQSKLFAKLSGTKTLTRAAINTIKELGYNITVMQQSL